MTIDILDRLQGQFNSLSLRISALSEKIKVSIVQIYENYPHPEKLEILLQ